MKNAGGLEPRFQPPLAPALHSIGRMSGFLSDSVVVGSASQRLGELVRWLNRLQLVGSILDGSTQRLEL